MQSSCTETEMVLPFSLFCTWMVAPQKGDTVPLAPYCLSDWVS